MARSAAGARFLLALALCLFVYDSAFLGWRTSSSSRARGRSQQAEGKAEQSLELVKVDNSSTMAASSLFGAITGFLFGGPWLAFAGFVAAASLVRKEDNDAADALKSVSAAGLKSVNFVAGVADKYEVGKKLGDAVDSAKESSPQLAKVVDQVSDAYKSMDQDINVKDTLGSIVTSADSLAAQAADKAGEVNEKYNVTGKITETVDDLISKAKDASKKA